MSWCEQEDGRCGKWLCCYCATEPPNCCVCHMPPVTTTPSLTRDEQPRITDHKFEWCEMHEKGACDICMHYYVVDGVTQRHCGASESAHGPKPVSRDDERDRRIAVLEQRVAALESGRGPINAVSRQHLPSPYDPAAVKEYMDKKTGRSK